MKKMIVAFVLLSSVMAVSQTKFGIKAGGNIATFTGKSFYDVGGRVGFQAGGFAEIKLSDRNFIQVDLLYSEQGAKVDFKDVLSDGISTLTYDEKWKLSYINLPVMFKFYAAQHLFFEAGPQLGVFLNAKSKYTTTLYAPELELIGPYDATKSGKERMSEDFKGLDVALNVGFGYDFTDHIFANARYSYGLVNIYEIRTDQNWSSEMKGHNNVFSLSAGYKF